MIEISSDTAIEAKIALEKSIAESQERLERLEAREELISPEMYANCLETFTSNLAHYKAALREISLALKAGYGKKAIY